MTNDNRHHCRRWRAITHFAVLGLVLSLSVGVRANQSSTPSDSPNVATGEVVCYVSSVDVVCENADGVYELDGEPCELDFSREQEFVLWFVLGDNAEPTKLFVSRDESWTETLWLDSGSFAYVIQPDGTSSYAFEVATGGQSVPTRPELILVPVEEPPSPQ